MKSSRFKFIVIEGIDGVGKTTITKKLCDIFIEYGEPAEILDMPPLELKDASQFINKYAPTIAHFYYYLSIVILSSEKAKKQLLTNHVICDRYILSTLAYHYAAEPGLSLDIRHLGILAPDLTVILSCEESERRKRIDARPNNKKGDELNLETSSFLQRTSENYHHMASSFNNFWIDTTTFTPDQVVYKILSNKTLNLNLKEFPRL